MKIKVRIRKVMVYCGVVEMTEERFIDYKCIKDMDIISSMLMKREVACNRDDWNLECFEELKEKGNEE